MNGNLLEIANYDRTVKHTRRGASPPLLLEFQVNRELAPYLVSSLRSVQWVRDASQHDTIRAAVRRREHVESEIIAAILQMGVEAEWGNVHALTTEGVAQCVEHLEYYEFGPLEFLVAPDTDLDGIELPDRVTQTRTKWVPQNALVVVPVDRGFVGTLGTIGKHKAVAVVHNPSRGIAIACR